MIARPFLIVAMILFSFSLHAQKPDFVIFGGAQATSAKYTIQNVKQPSEARYGPMAGLALKIPFENNLYFFPAVYYSRKGYEVAFNRFVSPPSDKALNNKTSIHTVELAPLFQIDLAKSQAHPFVRFGISADFVFGGTENFDTSANGSGTVTRPMVFSFGDYGRITASANFHLGYEFQNGLMLFAHYTHGLGDANNADGGPSILHRVTGLSLGWRFIKNPNIIDTRVKE
jgi:hypothetical protein